MSDPFDFEFSILPTFKPWEDYSTEELAAIVQGWQFIIDNPAFQDLVNNAYQSGWQQWHDFGQNCIAEIKAELDKRK